MIVTKAVVALERERSDAIANGSYARCRELQAVIERAKALRFDLLKKENQQCSALEVKIRRVQTQHSLQNLERVLKTREQMLDQRLAEYIDSTKNRQAQEFEQFTKKWQAEPIRRRYNRASGEYRNLKRQEVRLIQARRVEDAALVSREAAQRQKREVDSAYRAMEREYNESRQRIAEKHGVELSIASEVARRKREEFGCMADRMRKPWAARVKKLERVEESVQDPQRLWNRQRRFEGGVASVELVVRSARPVIGRESPSKAVRLPPLARSPRF
jgi:hypothetical protein